MPLAALKNARAKHFVANGTLQRRAQCALQQNYGMDEVISNGNGCARIIYGEFIEKDGFNTTLVSQVKSP